jgi:hypothetical protein
MKYMAWLLFFLGGAGLISPVQAAADEPPAHASKSCMNCHADYKTAKDILAGNFSSRSVKAKTIQMQIDERVELFKYTDETEVANVANIKDLKESMAIRVHYKMAGQDKVATKIVAKPEMKVPPEQLMSTEDLAKLVAMGPEKGRYTLMDSRPEIKYEAGYIPTAIPAPFAKTKETLEKSVKDKNSLVIFYCEGFR